MNYVHRPRISLCSMIFLMEVRRGIRFQGKRYFLRPARCLRRPSAVAMSRPMGRGSEDRRRILGDCGTAISGGGRGTSAAGFSRRSRDFRAETGGFFGGVTGFFGAGAPDAGAVSSLAADVLLAETPEPAAACFCRSALGGRGGRTALGVASKTSMGQGWFSTTGTFLPMSFSISLR